MLITIAPFGIAAKLRAHRMPSVSRVSGNRHTAMSVWARDGSSCAGPAKIRMSGFGPDADFEIGQLRRELVAPQLRVADHFVEIDDEQRHVPSCFRSRDAGRRLILPAVAPSVHRRVVRS